MTIVQITAIISLLLSFGVDTTTAENVRLMITPRVASTTPVVVVPVIATPIVENHPVYFGSVYSAPTPPPIVYTASMDVYSDKIFSKKTQGELFVAVVFKDENGHTVYDTKEKVDYYIDGVKVRTSELNYSKPKTNPDDYNEKVFGDNSSTMVSLRYTDKDTTLTIKGRGLTKDVLLLDLK